MSSNLRIALFACAASVVILVYAITHPVQDFIVYWSAAHLFVARQDPYSLLDVFRFQRTIAPLPIPIMLLCPPWVLGMISPLGYAHSYLLAWLVWTALLVASLALASRFLMDLYFDVPIREISDPPAYRSLFAFTFYPVLVALKWSQLGPILLLGVAGFLRFRNRPIVAGMFLALTFLKPQLFLLVWLGLLFHRLWKPLLCAVSIITSFCLIVLARDHLIFREYYSLMAGSYPSFVVAGVFAGVRSVLGTTASYWMEYLPSLFGLLWFAWWWRSNRPLLEQMPALMTASLAAAPYSLLHDQTLLVVPIIYLAGRAAREHGRLPFSLILTYTALNVVVLMVEIIATTWVVLPGLLVVSTYLAVQKGQSSGTLVVEEAPLRMR